MDGMPNMNDMPSMNNMDETDLLVAFQINAMYHNWANQSYGQALDQPLNQSFDQSLNPSQMLPPSSYMNNDYQIQWPEPQDPTGWGTSLEGPELDNNPDNTIQGMAPPQVGHHVEPQVVPHQLEPQPPVSQQVVHPQVVDHQALDPQVVGQVFPPEVAPQVAFNNNSHNNKRGTADDGVSIAGSNHCDAGCSGHCDDAAQADCCFDPSCQTIEINHAACLSHWQTSVNPAHCCYDPSCQGLDMNHTGCYFDPSCQMPTPCLDENCQEVSHRCDNESCMVPTVSTTPGSVPPFTPGGASESDPNPLTSPVKPSIEMDTASDHGTVVPGVESKSSLSLPLVMGEDDLLTCHWVFPGGGVCLTRFKDRKHLHLHCKEDHLKDLPKVKHGFSCSWHSCSREGAFSQKSKLERHMQTHTGYKPVECDICGLWLSAKQSLDQHLRTHTGEKPWKCEWPNCTRSFKQQSALSEKPLKCDQCDKRFSESSNLSKHRRIHSMKEYHVCALCGKKFCRLDQLRRHLLTCGTKGTKGTKRTRKDKAGSAEGSGGTRSGSSVPCSGSSVPRSGSSVPVA
ncbi:zinc-finger protein [Neonectria punicea]|uniref:Zinc-finger protein n=1 Tax=Neonectria punicea TaxID=979145 RepID=A0ABR1H4Y9_9HYPO